MEFCVAITRIIAVSKLLLTGLVSVMARYFSMYIAITQIIPVSEAKMTGMARPVNVRRFGENLWSVL